MNYILILRNLKIMENIDNRLELSDDEDNFYINITIALFIRYEN